jgi:hypothetical protein
VAALALTRYSRYSDSAEYFDNTISFLLVDAAVRELIVLQTQRSTERLFVEAQSRVFLCGMSKLP